MSWYQLPLLRKERLDASTPKTETEQQQKEELNESLFINAMPFMEGLQSYGMGRCFMTTKLGQIGWAPQSALAGDKIYILRGCRIPYVFRESSEEVLRLVGGAYVHGQMDYEPGVAAQDDSPQMNVI